MPDMGMIPSIETVAALMEITIDEAKILKAGIIEKYFSDKSEIIESVSECHLGEDVAKEDIPPETEAKVTSGLYDLIETCFEKEQEREILMYRFGFDSESVRPIEDVASRFNVSAARVNWLEAKALRMLRTRSRERKGKNRITKGVNKKFHRRCILE